MTEIHAQISESGIGGAFTMSIIAFTVVFLVLGGLSGIIYGIKYLAAGLGNKKAPLPPGGKTSSASLPAASVPTASAVPSIPPTPDSSPDRGRLLAVLAAAVAATSGRGGVIRSVTALPAFPRGGEEWKRIGIAEGHAALSRNWK